MPITRGQFEKGLDKTAYRILQFLGENPDKAYEFMEVAQGIGEWNPPKDTGRRILYAIGMGLGIGGQLDDLVNKGFVDKKVITGTTWYSIHKK